ncbi:MAG TPA: HAD family hydrolase [Thermoanaerobaculia bacterium]|nr:HAD family hydrolase [Thermoanaerobaculia bacterium]
MSGGWILLDLDGPLLDVLPRYHRLHSDLVLRHGGRPLDPEAYWDAKRKRGPEPQILAKSGLDPGAIREVLGERARWIESWRYLQLDRTWPWTEAVLTDLSRRAPLVLVTARRHRRRLLRQLGELGLRGHFHRIVSGPGDETAEAKARLLRDSRLPIPPGSVLVGDTEVDLASGRALGLRTAALTCGIRCAALLTPWNPDALLADLRDVPGWLASLPSRRRMSR